MEEKTIGLELLRKPFPDNQIGKLAKGSKAQMQCNANEKKNCSICGGWHHPKLIHLDFVGHAALTDRLLDVDPLWTWEPMALSGDGLPAFDSDGGLWIKVTILGRSMLGYGNAEPSQYKEVGSRQKECIGDALRNACMRLGAALELWHKGDLHVDDTPVETPEEKTARYKKVIENETLKKEQKGKTEDLPIHDKTAEGWTHLLKKNKTPKERTQWLNDNAKDIKADVGTDGFKQVVEHMAKINLQEV